MFDGPGHAVNPSSVSRMSYKDSSRRSTERSAANRRKSIDSVRSHARGRAGRRASMDSRQHSFDNEREHLLGSQTVFGKARERRRSPSPINSPKPTVFENIAHLFGRTGSTNDLPSHHRSPSVTSTAGRSVSSLRSDAASEHALETDNEDWGYTSGEEDLSDPELPNDDNSMVPSMEYDSRPPSPNASFPLLTHDPVFGGDARIDMGTSFDDLDPPPPGPPSRQAIYIVDENTTLRIVGYECLRSRQHLWHAGCIFTFGILALIGHWFPRLWLRYIAKEKAFIDTENGFVVVDVSLEVWCVDGIVPLTVS